MHIDIDINIDITINIAVRMHMVILTQWHKHEHFIKYWWHVAKQMWRDDCVWKTLTLGIFQFKIDDVMFENSFSYLCFSVELHISKQIKYQHVFVFRHGSEIY